MSIENEQSSAPEVYASGHLANVAAAVRGWVHPTAIGRYHVLELIGEGGMGSVYKAEQRTPIRRVVAVKLIKAGMDTAQVIARFEGERQALAVMDHPNVARVLDAGATETGRPYFVMEYVAGEPITRFADAQRLTVRERLELFTQACDAVQHAHQKAIIHRDLKPSNILVSTVDGQPVVKVIDFGIAKAIDQRLTERTVFTESGQFLGTPEYMSPEQADSSVLDPDTRTDVYSLGVVLYELLAGALPFDPKTLRSAGYNEIQRIIRDVEPPRPSTRLSSLGAGARQVARQRQTQLDDLRKQLSGELEWIPLRAMRKERARRYASAAALAEDIDNFLSNRPLRAAPDSAAYRLRKFLRRNRAPVAVAAIMAALLISGIVTTTWQAARATRAQRQTRAALVDAEQANASMHAVNEFLTLDVLWSAAPEVTRGREVTVREALDNAARTVGARFKDRPLTEAVIRGTLANAYVELGEAATALQHAQAGLEIVRRIGYAEKSEGLELLSSMGSALQLLGRTRDADEYVRKSLEGRRRLLGERHEKTIHSMIQVANSAMRSGSPKEAESLVREAFRLSETALGADHPQALVAEGSLVWILREQNRLSEAEAHARHCVELSTRINGADHPTTLGNKKSLADVLEYSGRYDEAERISREVVEDSRRVYGEGHQYVAARVNDLANLLRRAGKNEEEAARLLTDSLERARQKLGEDHPLTLNMMNNLAVQRLNIGRFDEAERLSRAAYESNRRREGDDAADTLAYANNLAYAVGQLGRTAEAEQIFRRVAEAQRRTLGAEHPSTLATVNNIGWMLFQQKDFSGAERTFREVWDVRRRTSGEAHPETLGVLSNLGRMVEYQGRWSDTEPLYAELYRLTPTAQVPPHQAAMFMSHWGEALVALGRHEQAEVPLRETIERLTAAGQQKTDYMKRSMTCLIEVYEKTARSDAAAGIRAELAELQSTTRPATRSAGAPTTSPTPR